MEADQPRCTSSVRLIVFDKRGTGISDPVEAAPTLEERLVVQFAVPAAGFVIFEGLQ